MIAPKILLVKDGQILSVGLVNNIISRIEYAADLLRQYKLVAGDEMYVEPHFDGTRVSYLQPVAGGASPRRPLLPFPYPTDVTPPTNPTILGCGDSIAWSKNDFFGFDVCPTVGPPCGSGEISCAGRSVSGYIVSSGIWPNSCLASRSPSCAFSANWDDSGTLGDFIKPYVLCVNTPQSGIITAKKGSYDANNFFLYVDYTANNGPQGGPYGFTGSGSFSLV